MHETMPFVNMFCFYQYNCQSHCLFEHASHMIFSKNVWEVSREQLSCNKKVHQYIMLSQLKNILTRQIQWTIDWKRIWYGVASWKIKLNTWQHALGPFEKENFPAPPQTKSVDTKPDIRGCFDDFQMSTWKISKRTRGEKLKFVRRLEGRM